LKSDGFNTHPKVYMTGFSNGGVQSNVFPFMHPEYVEATAPGGTGRFLVPFKEVENHEFTWPIGLADADKIEGWKFDAEEFKHVEHFTFAGELDDEGATDGDIAKDLDFLSLLSDRSSMYKEIFGVDPYERVKPYTRYLLEFGVEATYKIYEGYGHDFPMIMKRDVFEFFESIPVE